MAVLFGDTGTTEHVEQAAQDDPFHGQYEHKGQEENEPRERVCHGFDVDETDPVVDAAFTGRRIPVFPGGPALKVGRV